MIPVLAPSAGAAEPLTPGDEAAVQKALTSVLKAAKKEDWKGLAKYMHPETLARFRAAKQKQLRAELRTLKRLAHGDDDKARMKKLEELLTLEPEPFFVAMIEAEGAGGMFNSDERRIVGTVLEKKDLAHAIVEREKLPPLVATPRTERGKIRMEVFSLKRKGDEWRILYIPGLEDDLDLAEAFFEPVHSVKPAGKDEGEAGKGTDVLIPGEVWIEVCTRRGLLQEAPESRYVADEKAWAKLWKAWRGDEALPKVDFDKELMIIYTVPGPHSPTPALLLSDGDLQIGYLGFGGDEEKDDGKSFGYYIGRVKRDRIKTIDGEAIKKK
jgi:hypothetical protein